MPESIVAASAAPSAPSFEPPGAAARVSRVFSDGWAVLLRDLSRLRHAPALAFLGVAAPAGFLLIFAYLFGGAVSLTGSGVSRQAYREYLVPGIFATTVINGMVTTAGTAAEDSLRGITDRIRSLPAARSALLFGRTGTDLLLAVFSLAVMAGCGYAVGWRADRGAAQTLSAFGLLLLFSYAVGWAGTWMGLAVGSREAMQLLGPVLFGLPFYSAAFVPTAGMPTVLRAIAEWNPVSALVVACRRDFGDPGGTVPGGAWPLQHPTLAAVGYALIILLIAVPAAVRRMYRGR
ncbi:MAG TPA: ABC transporter permease [Actinocrinis sp.]|jgi:ABC-2 type transport system permease protein